MHSKILPFLLEVLPAFYIDGYDKINELSYPKCSLASRINKLRDTAIESSLKDIFLRPGTPS